MANNRDFWGGFAFGALAGAAGALLGSAAASSIGSSYDSRILRMEKSVQIGLPVEEVFAAWSNFAELPLRISCIEEVSNDGREWRIWVDGRGWCFRAETEQYIPNQAIGWKSIDGPKHSGRINFARLGNDTLVHVSMNYAPPLGRFGRLLAPLTDHVEGHIEAALREFKQSLEGKGAEGAQFRQIPNTGRRGFSGKGPQSAGWDEVHEPMQRTGTDKSGSISTTRNNAGSTTSTSDVTKRDQKDEYGGVDFQRPPKASY